MNPETTIKSCILPKRVKTCLAKAGIDTIGQLLESNKYDISRLPQFGPNCMLALRNFMLEKNIEFKINYNPAVDRFFDSVLKKEVITDQFKNYQAGPIEYELPKQEKWALLIISNQYLEKIEFSDKMLCEQAFEQFNKLRPNGVNFIFQKLRIA
jgi:hypothetical protein